MRLGEISSAKAGPRRPRTLGKVDFARVQAPGGHPQFVVVPINYKTDDDGLHMTDIDGKVQDGHFGGQATWPWDATKPATANIDWQNVDIVDIALQGSKTEFKATGKSSGTLAWSALPSDVQDITLHDIELQSEIPELIVNGVPSGNVVLSVTRQTTTDSEQKGGLRYDVSGNLLRGHLAANGNISRANVADD